MSLTTRVLPLTVALTLALAACGKKEESVVTTAPQPAAAPAIEIIKIGHVGPISGPIAHLGKDNENGARMAVDEINAAGGLKLGEKTYKLELVAEDDKSDPKEGPITAQKLMDAGVVAVVGHLNSGTTIPASKVYAENGVAHISPSATAVSLTEQGFKTTFRVVARDDKQGAVLAQFAHETLKARNVAIIDDRTQYGQGLADEFEKSIKAANVKVVAHEFTSDKATDFNAILTKIRALKPDVIMYGGMDATAGPMAKQIQQLGIKATLIAGDGACSPEFVKLADKAASILKCSMAGEAVEKFTKGEEFKAHYKAKFASEVQLYSPYSYDAVYVIAEALKKAGKPDRAAVAAALPGVTLSGVTGEIAFDEKGDIKSGAISVFEVKDGKLEYVTTVR